MFDQRLLRFRNPLNPPFFTTNTNTEGTCPVYSTHVDNSDRGFTDPALGVDIDQQR